MLDAMSTLSIICTICKWNDWLDVKSKQQLDKFISKRIKVKRNMSGCQALVSLGNYCSQTLLDETQEYINKHCHFDPAIRANCMSNLSLFEEKISNNIDDIFRYLGSFLTIGDICKRLCHCNRNLFIVTQNGNFFHSNTKNNRLYLTRESMKTIIRNKCEMIAFSVNCHELIIVGQPFGCLHDCTTSVDSSPKNFKCVLAKLFDASMWSLDKMDGHQYFKNPLKWIPCLLSKITILGIQSDWHCATKHLPLETLLLINSENCMGGDKNNININDDGGTKSLDRVFSFDKKFYFDYKCGEKVDRNTWWGKLNGTLFENFCTHYQAFLLRNHIDNNNNNNNNSHTSNKLRQIWSITPRMYDALYTKCYLSLNKNYQCLTFDKYYNKNSYNINSISQFYNIFHSNIKRLCLCSGSDHTFISFVQNIFDSSVIDTNQINQEIEKYYSQINININEKGNYKQEDKSKVELVLQHWAVSTPDVTSADEIKFSFNNIFKHDAMCKLFKLNGNTINCLVIDDAVEVNNYDYDYDYDDKDEIPLILVNITHHLNSLRDFVRDIVCCQNKFLMLHTIHLKACVEAYTITENRQIIVDWLKIFYYQILGKYLINLGKVKKIMFEFYWRWKYEIEFDFSTLQNVKGDDVIVMENTKSSNMKLAEKICSLAETAVWQATPQESDEYCNLRHTFIRKS